MLYSYTANRTITVYIMVFMVAITKLVTKSICTVSVVYKSKGYFNVFGNIELFCINTLVCVVKNSFSCRVTGISVCHIPFQIIPRLYSNIAVFGKLSSKRSVFEFICTYILRIALAGIISTVDITKEIEIGFCL